VLHLDVVVRPRKAEPGCSFERALADEVRALNAVPRLCIGSELDAVAHRLVEVMPEACHFFPREALTEWNALSDDVRALVDSFRKQG
jgi:glycerophosphoryl diester phosphodiesterase